MKKHSYYITLLLVTLFSCVIQKPNYIIVDDTKEFLTKFKTKNDIIDYFNLPDIKKSEGEFEEWYYDLGKTRYTSGDGSISSTTTTNSSSTSSKTTWGSVISNGLSKSGSSGVFGFNAKTNELSNYVKFVFKDNVIIKREFRGYKHTYKKYKDN